MKTVIISQARMTSTRLPGKVLKQVLRKPLLEYHLERLIECRLADEVCVATTINETDDPIVALCCKLGVPVFRGSEDDVLSRYVGAAEQLGADVIVRVTSDCPVIDPGVINEAVCAFRNGGYDYLSNTIERTYPRGMDAEVLSMFALRRAHRMAREPAEREHVTPYIYRRPGEFSLGTIRSERDHSSHRWTVDTLEDFMLIQEMITRLYPVNPKFSLNDCLLLLQEHPELSALNAHIEQKKLGQ